MFTSPNGDHLLNRLPSISSTVSGEKKVTQANGISAPADLG